MINSIDLSSDERVRRVSEALLDIKKASAFQKLTKGGGQNSPGLYRRKIEYVAKALRSVQ